MTLSPRERERLEALVAAYRRLPREEPPAAVDAAVMKQARAALRTSARPRWPTLLATAATMTLAIGLAWQLREAEVRIEAQRPAEVAPPPAAAPEPPPPGEAPAPPVALTLPPVLEDAPTDTRDADASTDAALEPTRAKAETAPARAATTGEIARQARRDEAAPAVGARAAPSGKVAAKPFPAVEESSQASGPPPDAQSAEIDEAREAPPPAAPPPPAPQPAAATASTTQAPAMRDAAANQAREEEAKRAQDALGLRSERARASDEALSPQAWLDEIARLLRTGQRERAIESLREFRRAHPQVELPPELRDLLP